MHEAAASKLAWGRKYLVLGGKQDHRRIFQDTPFYPRQVASTVAMSAFIEVAREWVHSAQVQAWLARVLEDLGGEHPVG